MPPAAKKARICLTGDGGPGSCVMIDGHGGTRAEVRKSAYDFLIASEEWDVDRADDSTENALVSRAWFADDLKDDDDNTGSFVGPDHPGAKAVTVVNLNTNR